MTTLPPLVGLIGKKRVGKDTFAAILVEEFGFVRVAFADPLKEMALIIDPYIHGLAGTHRLSAVVDTLGWEGSKDFYPEVRRLLQRLGDGVRQFDPEFWLRAGLTQAWTYRHGYPESQPAGVVGMFRPRPVVITDVRYPNEADAIRDAGGSLVRIVRDGVDDGDTHASETALDGYDVESTVFNTASIDDLRYSARTMAGGGPGGVF